MRGLGREESGVCGRRTAVEYLAQFCVWRAESWRNVGNNGRTGFERRVWSLCGRAIAVACSAECILALPLYDIGKWKLMESGRKHTDYNSVYVRPSYARTLNGSCYGYCCFLITKLEVCCTETVVAAAVAVPAPPQQTLYMPRACRNLKGGKTGNVRIT